MSFFRVNQAVVLGPGEGTHLDVLGDLITLLLGDSPYCRKSRRREEVRPCTLTTRKMKPCTSSKANTKSSAGIRRFAPSRARSFSHPEIYRTI